MIDGTTLVVIMVVVWLGWSWIGGSIQMKRSHRDTQKAAEELREKLRKEYNADEKEIQLLGYFGLVSYMERKDREREVARNRADKENAKRHELRMAAIKREEERIEKEYKHRPTVEEVSSEEFSYVDENSVDYLKFDIEGGTTQIRIAYLTEEDLERIESSEDPEWEEREMVLNEWSVVVLQWINKAELGTSTMFQIEENLPDPSSVDRTFLEFVETFFGEIGEDVVALSYEIVSTKSTVIYGSVGLSKKIESEDILEDISFYDTYMIVNGKNVEYNDFPYEDVSSWNPVSEGRIMMEDIEDYDSIWDII